MNFLDLNIFITVVYYSNGRCLNNRKNIKHIIDVLINMVLNLCNLIFFLINKLYLNVYETALHRLTLICSILDRKTFMTTL